MAIRHFATTFARVAGFELRYQTRSPAFWVSFIFFFLIAFLTTVSDNVQIASGEEVLVNSPFAIAFQLAVFSIFALFITATVIPGSVLREADTGMSGLIYSAPMNRLGFLFGRFTGAYCAAMLAFLGAPLAMAVGIHAWWLDPETIGPFRPLDYLYLSLVFGIPNLMVTGAIFFAVAVVTRRQAAVYVAMVALIVLYVAVPQLIDGPDSDELGALFDPFGAASFIQVARYWTPLEQNTLLVPLEGYFLANRLGWLGIALVLLVGACLLFRMETQARGATKTPSGRSAATPETPFPDWRTFGSADPATPATVLQQLVMRSRYETGVVLRSVGLWIMLLIFGALVASNLSQINDDLFGTPLYPVTRVVAETATASFLILMFIVTIFYSGELVWRERQFKAAEIISACPTPSWVFVLSKLSALVTVLILLLIVPFVLGVAFQLSGGVYDIQLEVYGGVFVIGLLASMVYLAILAFLVQALVPNKYYGFMAMVGVLLLLFGATRLGVVDNLVRFAGRPGAPHSDMNGFGHFLEPLAWFNLYWGFFCIILLVLAHRMWPDVVASPWRARVARLWRGWTRGPATIGLVALAGMVMTGGWIAYNTHGLNSVRNSDDVERRLAQFERSYVKYLGVAQPDIVDVKIHLDIFPESRGFTARGTYLLENRTGGPIEEVFLKYNDGLVDIVNAMDGSRTGLSDTTYNFYSLQLEEPMQPGERRTMSFEARMERRGFRNDADVSPVVYNGTFLNNRVVTPSLGFPSSYRIGSPETRRKHGLPTVRRTAPLEDTSRHVVNDIAEDSDFITFETTVSTSLGQIAVAPGYLQREWEENGRRYFHYKMDAPILNFYSWLSAEYTVLRDKWNDVELSIYYHAPHDFNVARMIDSMKKSLEYFTANFGSYQHRQLRVLEFPAYARFAQSFPNTVPYSESIGFIADNRDPEDIDYVFYVTSHEVAHQWWGHQVVSASVQGASLITEGLSQYAALMVMEREYGTHQVRRYLKYELDRYLRGRTRETREELPLYRVEGQQYLHYNKASLAFYALKDYVGEAAVNRALARLVAETKFKSDPYPTSLDLIRLLREEAGPEHQDLITDLFQKIVLFDLRVEDHSIEALPDGKVKLRLDLHAEKFEVDAEGKETTVPLDMAIDIGVFTRDPSKPDFGDGDIAHFQKHRITEKNPTIELVVDAADTLWFGIDPYHKLIDRRTNDNLESADGRPSGTPQASGGAGGSTSR